MNDGYENDKQDEEDDLIDIVDIIVTYRQLSMK